MALRFSGGLRLGAATNYKGIVCHSISSTIDGSNHVPRRPPHPPMHPWPASPLPDDDKLGAQQEPDISEQATGLLIVPAGHNILLETMVSLHQREIERLSGWRKQVHERLEQAAQADDPALRTDLQKSLRMLFNKIEAHYRAIARLRAQRD